MEVQRIIPQTIHVNNTFSSRPAGKSDITNVVSSKDNTLSFNMKKGRIMRRAVAISLTMLAASLVYFKKISHKK